MQNFAAVFKFSSYWHGVTFTTVILPGCIFSVYACLYFLFPFFQKKKYVLFGIFFIVVAMLNCTIELFFYLVLRPYHCPDCDVVTLREKINIVCAIGINVAGILGLIALGIKFTKSWYLQQVHNRVLARQKITSELKLLKMRIQPDFLFESLKALHRKIVSNRNQAAEMLLRFSELLSYTLYECNADFVPVLRELFVINEFIALENIMQKAPVIFSENNTENISEKFIPSFILLSFIQNCVIAFYENIYEQTGFSIKINGGNDTVFCVLHIQSSSSVLIKNIYVPLINTYINRLENVYKNNYTLGFAEEQRGSFIITMSLLLVDNFSKEKIDTLKEQVYAHTYV